MFKILDFNWCTSQYAREQTIFYLRLLRCFFLVFIVPGMYNFKRERDRGRDLCITKAHDELYSDRIKRESGFVLSSIVLTDKTFFFFATRSTRNVLEWIFLWIMNKTFCFNVFSCLSNPISFNYIDVFRTWLAWFDFRCYVSTSNENFCLVNREEPLKDWATLKQFSDFFIFSLFLQLDQNVTIDFQSIVSATIWHET